MEDVAQNILVTKHVVTKVWIVEEMWSWVTKTV